MEDLKGTIERIKVFCVQVLNFSKEEGIMKRRLLSIFLSLCMIFTLMPVSLMAEDTPISSDNKEEIIVFEPIEETEIRVPVGTSIDDLKLPETLSVITRKVLTNTECKEEAEGVWSGVTTSSAIDIEITRNIQVTWSSQPEYDENTPGEYVFKPVIEGYIISTKLPEVKVTVGALAAKNMLLADGPTIVVNNATEMALALEDAVDGTTVVLGKAVTNMGYIPRIPPGSTSNITIDLNGFTFSGNEGIALTHEGSGTLTIKDSVGGGKIYAYNTNKHTIVNYENGNVRVLSGEVRVSAKNGVAILNVGSGEVQVVGGLVSATGENTSAIRNTRSGKVTISGGDITATGTDGIGIDMIDGTLYTAPGTYTISGNKMAMSVPPSGYSGGSISGSKNNVNGSDATDITTADVNTNDKVQEYKYLKFASYVAQISSVKYSDLQKAFNVALEGSTIKLIGNINLSKPITIVSGDSRNLTLDLNGQTIDGGSNNVITHQGSGTLAINGGGSGYTGSITSTNGDSSGTICLEGGNLQLNSGTIYNFCQENENAVVILNKGTGTVTINNSGKVEGTKGIAIKNSSTGNVNILGGSVYVKSGNAIKNLSTGTLDISGGQVSTQDSTAAIFNEGNGKITVRGTAQVKNQCKYSNQYAIYLNSGTDDETILEIKGGYMNASPMGTAIYNNADGVIKITSGSTSSISSTYMAMNVAPDLSSYGDIHIMGNKYNTYSFEAIEITKENIDTNDEVRAYKYLSFGPLTVPAAPVNLKATPGDGEVTLEWKIRDTGGSPIIRYEISTDSGATWIDIGNEDTRYTVKGLTNGTKYLFDVRAVNVKGEGGIEGIYATPAITNYTISGKVKGSDTNSGIENAYVQLIGSDNTAVATTYTGSSGAYSFAAKPGTYKIMVSADGYEDGNISNVVVSNADLPNMDVTLTKIIPFSAVENITMTNVTSVKVNTDLTLEADVSPNDATNQSIVWSVENPNATSATISGNTFRATAPGTATVKATIIDGLGTGSDYTQTFTIIVTEEPVVTYSISGTVKGSDTNSGIAGAKVQLKKEDSNIGSPVFTDSNGAYTISNVLANTYSIEVSADGYVNGTLNDVIVRSEDVTGKDLTLTKIVTFIPVEQIIMNNASSAQVNTDLILKGTVSPANATNSTIIWSIEEANSTGATISGNTLKATAAGSATVKATVVNGLGIGRDYTKTFVITVNKESVETYRITAGAGTGGSISPSGMVTVNHGMSKTFTITPNKNYSTQDVKVDNISQGAITSYTFNNVSADHTIFVTFKYNGSGSSDSSPGSLESKNPVIAQSSAVNTPGNASDYIPNLPVFTDITSHWAKNDIEFMVNLRILNGTDTYTFSPNTKMTRGMFVTVLGRLAQADISSYNKNRFTDVANDAYYSAYIEWANKNGIANGMGNGTFAPNQPITREQMAVMMYSYAKAMGITLPQIHEERSFADSDKISEYAKEAVKIMQMAGVISGKDGNLFDPQLLATRAEVSAVLSRFVRLIDIQMDDAQLNKE